MRLEAQLLSACAARYTTASARSLQCRTEKGYSGAILIIHAYKHSFRSRDDRLCPAASLLQLPSVNPPPCIVDDDRKPLLWGAVSSSSGRKHSSWKIPGRDEIRDGNLIYKTMEKGGWRRGAMMDFLRNFIYS